MPIKTTCLTEYDKLKKVIVCEPKFLMKPESLEVSIDLAIKQHRHFVSALKDYGVEVLQIEPLQQFPEQVFTRDTGFVLGGEMFVARVQNYKRQGEEHHLSKLLEERDVPFQALSMGMIEGGDVLIDKNTVYVGQSNRTNEEASKELQRLLPDYEVIMIPFTDAYLHLDCVFNILSATEALIYSEEIHGDKIELLKKRYDLINVTKEEQANLATNILSLGEKRVFSLPKNKELNFDLRQRGYEVIEVDISEVIKFGGSFRCCTLPLLRE